MNPEDTVAPEEAEELVEVSTDVPYNTDEFLRDLLMEQQEQM